MRTLILAAACLGATAAGAHDFWVQPRDFTVAAATPVPFTIWVGHGKDRQRWSAPIDRVTTFAAIGPGGTRDLRAALRPAGGPSDAEASFAAPGTYVVVLETTRAESTLPGLRFTDYIKAEGIAPAIAARTHGAADAPGRELYSRRAKALVHVGPPGTAQPQVTKPVGLTLEIVPERDPTAAGFDSSLPVTVLYEGHPLAGAFVKLNNLDFDQRPVETHITDARGHAAFTVPFKGQWQMNVVWTKPLTGNPRADFDTVFSSLAFGTR